MDWSEESQQNVSVPFSMPFTGIEHVGIGPAEVAKGLADVINDPTTQAIESACAWYNYDRHNERTLPAYALVEPSAAGPEVATLRFRVSERTPWDLAREIRRLAAWLEVGVADYPGWTVTTSRASIAPRHSPFPSSPPGMSWSYKDGLVTGSVFGDAWGVAVEGRVSVLTENGWLERCWTFSRRAARTPDMAKTFFPGICKAKDPIAEASRYLQTHGPRKPRDPNVVLELPATAFGETRLVRAHETSGRGWAHSLDHVFAGTAGPTGKKIYPSLARFKHVEGQWLLAEDNWCLNRDGGRKVAWFDKLENTALRARRHGKGQ